MKKIMISIDGRKAGPYLEWLLVSIVCDGQTGEVSAPPVNLEGMHTGGGRVALGAVALLAALDWRSQQLCPSKPAPTVLYTTLITGGPVVHSASSRSMVTRGSSVSAK